MASNDKLTKWGDSYIIPSSISFISQVYESPDHFRYLWYFEIIMDKETRYLQGDIREVLESERQELIKICTNNNEINNN